MGNPRFGGGFLLLKFGDELHKTFLWFRNPP